MSSGKRCGMTANRTRASGGAALATGLALVLLAGCTGYPYVPCPPRMHRALGEMRAGYGIVRLLYATDRKPTKANVASLYFGVDRDRSLNLGTCDVSIPARHGCGRLETPLIPGLAQPDRHVMMLSLPGPLGQPAFLAELNRRLKRSPRREVFVFVHGYYTSFQDAARLTAQIAHDAGFDGVAVCYSWPSEAWLTGYLVDAVNAQWTVPHLAEFLRMLAAESEAAHVHVLAHSMGTRSVARAIRELVQSHPDDLPRFDEIILAAADIDAEIFERDYAEPLSRASRRLTLYVSTADWALGGSRFLHKYTRLGQTGPLTTGAAWMKNVEVIDATAVDKGMVGHVYYAKSPAALRDLAGVLQGLPPEQRGLRRENDRYALEPIAPRGVRPQP